MRGCRDEKAQKQDRNGIYTHSYNYNHIPAIYNVAIANTVWNVYRNGYRIQNILPFLMSCFCAFFIPTSSHFLEENFCFL